MQLKISKKLKPQNTLKDNEEKLRRLGRISSHAKQEPQSNRKFRMLYGRPSRPLRVGSLFSGIGGFEQALKLLRVRQDIVFACDSDQHVKSSYLANHGERLNKEGWFDDVKDFAKNHANRYKNKVITESNKASSKSKDAVRSFNRAKREKDNTKKNI